MKEYFETLKERVSPDLVLTHHGSDLHQDHRLVAELTWNTFRDHLILEYEIPKYDGDLGSPNVFVHLEEARRDERPRSCSTGFRPSGASAGSPRTCFSRSMRLRGMEAGSPTGYAEGFHGRKVVLGRL